MKRTERDDERDEGLGAVLRAAVDASLGSPVSRVSVRRARSRFRRDWTWLAAAAVLAVAGASALGGNAAWRRGRVSAAALALAEHVLPERSAWVADALSGTDDGTLPRAETMLFIESLWAGSDAF